MSLLRLQIAYDRYGNRNNHNEDYNNGHDLIQDIADHNIIS